MASINIGNPLAVIFAVVQIQHGSDCIHTDSVCMVLFGPEQGIGNQEIGNLRSSVIINQSSPVRMCSLPRIGVFIDAGAVKRCQSIAVSWEMSRYPVQNYADSLLMHIIHEIHKIVRRTVAAGRRIISGYLVAPGSV